MPITRIQPVGGDALEIGGVIGRCESVVVAAVRRDDLAELTVRQLVGRLEHQMLEKMREAGFALGLVGRSDTVPDHLGDDRCAVILDHHPLQAVGQREGLEVAGARLGGRSREEKNEGIGKAHGGKPRRD